MERLQSCAKAEGATLIERLATSLLESKKSSCWLPSARPTTARSHPRLQPFCGCQVALPHLTECCWEGLRSSECKDLCSGRLRHTDFGSSSILTGKTAAEKFCHDQVHCSIAISGILMLMYCTLYVDVKRSPSSVPHC